MVRCAPPFSLVHYNYHYYCIYKCNDNVLLIVDNYVFEFISFFGILSLCLISVDVYVWIVYMEDVRLFPVVPCRLICCFICSFLWANECFMGLIIWMLVICVMSILVICTSATCCSSIVRNETTVRMHCNLSVYCTWPHTKYSILCA